MSHKIRIYPIANIGTLRVTVCHVSAESLANSPQERCWNCHHHTFFKQIIPSPLDAPLCASRGEWKPQWGNEEPCPYWKSIEEGRADQIQDLVGYQV